MYFFDNRRHRVPHIHVKYQDQEAILSIPEGDILEGVLKPNKMKLVLSWIEIHKDELNAISAQSWSISIFLLCR